MASTDDRYWAEYNGLQAAKHQLLRAYLGGWFPILASWQGRVLYIDCHAGRGRHVTGDEGSPLLALRLLLDHRQRSRILASTQVNFVFFETNADNHRDLMSEVQSLGPMPANIHVYSHQADYEAELRQVIGQMRAAGSRLAPSFAFVDPYGFTLSMDLLNDLLAFPNCELLVNFMYRYVDLAIHQPSQSANMDALFGTSTWRQLASIDDPDQRSGATIKLFSSQLRARFATNLYMRGANGGLKYVLIHATNHKKGREVMKQALWSVTPDGSFTALERDSPNQPVLIRPDPDLAPLERALWNQFKGRSVRMVEVYDWLQNQVYLRKHLHTVIHAWLASSAVTADDYEGRFAFIKNPRIVFPDESLSRG